MIPSLQHHRSIQDVLNELKEEGDGVKEEESEEVTFTKSSLKGLTVMSEKPMGAKSGLEFLSSDQFRKERSLFQQARSEAMTEQDYLAFQQCRLANFLSKGR